MSQYSTLKRRPVLFPASAADFSKNLFAMKEEIKALIADDPANKAEYAQAAVEVAIDLQSGLTDWVLAKLVDKADCKAASEDLPRLRLPPSPTAPSSSCAICTARAP